MGWNARFAASWALPADALQEGMPLDELVRQQANAGRFGALDDVEAEVANRVTLMRSGQTVEMAPPASRCSASRACTPRRCPTAA